MEEIIGFNNLNIGQRIKVRGLQGSEGIFNALQIEIKPHRHQSTIIGLLQNIDLRRNTLRVFDRKITVPDTTVITDVNGRLMGMVDLKPSSRLKLKGNYSELEGFMLERIEVTDGLGFNIDKLEGVIDHLDAASKTLSVLGFTVQLSGKTMIAGVFDLALEMAGA
ncbi:MAG: DUF5666 domain-containing protein [bacterium]